MQCRRCKKEIPIESKFCLHCGAKQEMPQSRRSRGNGQGTAYKRGKTWTAAWTESTYLDDEGKLHQKRVTKGGFTSKTAALNFAMNRVVVEKQEREPTLADYHKTYLSTGYENISKSKQVAMDIAWRRMKTLYDVPIKDLTIDNLQACIDAETETYYPAKDMKTLFSHMYKRAAAEGRVASNITEYLQLPPLNETEQTPFNAVEIEKMWKAYDAGDPMIPYVLLMIYTGMMPGELMRCTVEMIDLKKHEIFGCALKTKKRKSTPMIYPDWFSPVVEKMIDGLKPTDKVLIYSRHLFYKNYYETLRAIGVRNLPPYSCRHTTGTALALAKTAPSLIQEIMRHTKFSTTQRYIHPDMTAAHVAINVLQEKSL